MDVYVQKILESDGRVKEILGNALDGMKPKMLTAEENDCSEEALRPAKDFITKKLLNALSKNKDMKLLGTKFNEEELKQMFGFMQHLNYPIMMFGSYIVPFHFGFLVISFWILT